MAASKDIQVAVIGASGVVGRALLEHLMQSDIPSIGLSRRPPADLPGANFVPLDLQDTESCRALAASTLQETTHIVYTALYEKPGLIRGWHEEDQMQTNLTMLKNLLEPIQRSSKIRHVTLLQGTKAYGAHVAPMKIPGIEAEPRHSHKNFYWLQEDALQDYCKRNSWTRTIWRPQVIFGHALHAPMNMLAAIGVYAALQKEKGLPLTYPGGPSGVSEAIDADLLAAAIAHSLDNPAFADETFNITNGDVFRFHDLWPALGDIFKMPVGEPARQPLAQNLYEDEATWQAVVKKHNLQPYSIRELVGDSFYYADALLNTHSEIAPPPALLSTIKLRKAGFHDCIDTTAMFRRWFTKLAALRVLP